MPVRQNIIAYGLNRSTGHGHAATCMIGQQENHHDYVELLIKHSTSATTISLDDKSISLWELYTRHQFETDIQHYLIDVEKVVLDTIAESGLEPAEIDAVVKTGGSSNIPLFTEMLTRIFGAGKVKGSNTFSSVVAGLAIKAFNHSPLVGEGA